MTDERVARTRGPELDLGRLQTWLQTAITDPHGGIQDATRRAGAAVGAPGLPPETVAVPSNRLGAEERVRIYRRMYLARLQETLADDYPAVRHHIGAEAFRRLTSGYAERFPSRSYTLARFGDRLPDYLAQHWDDDDGPLLHDLARLEAAMNRAFDAEPGTRLSPDALGHIPPEAWATTRLAPVPSLELLSLRYEVGRHVAAAQQDLEPPAPRRRATFVAVYQRDWAARWIRLSRPAFTVLTALAEGSDLADGLARGVVTLSASQREQKVFEWFRVWFREGLFGAVERSG